MSSEPVQGDADLAAFCAEHHARLVGLLILRVGDRHVAEELAQDALVRLVERWDRVRDLQAPWPWLVRVAVNLSTSRWRRRAAERRALARVGPPEGSEELDSSLAVLDLVGRLPPRQAMAVVLRHYALLSVDETAEIMRCRPGTVKALSAQGRARLRELVVEEVDDVGR
ncbi:MAG: sigma-70 family RNA polymerase sigma factor [Actinomycetota bacterium]